MGRRSKNNPDPDFSRLLGRLEGSITEISKGIKTLETNQQSTYTKINEIEKYMWTLPCAVHGQKLDNTLKKISSHEAHHREHDKRLLVIAGLMLTAITFIVETLKWVWQLLHNE
jgi:hypothetical protein